MNKKTVFKEIHKELQKLNNRIDQKIIQGCTYNVEARRHKQLLSMLQRISREEHKKAVRTERFRIRKSPVRRRLEKGVVSRVFQWNFA
jgi:hypothetical protein